MRPSISVLAMPRLFVFPGMGATSEMYADLSRHVSDAKYCNWPPHDGCLDFGDYAQKCILTYGISRNDVMAGSSMGGMIAAEISAQLGNDTLLLIGSCLQPKCVPFHRLTNAASFLLGDGAISLIGTKGRFSLLAKMAKQSGAPFIRWGLQALYRWNGVNLSRLRTVRSIHGCLDPIIPVFLVKPDERIATGGHFIAMTHARRVGRFVNDSLCLARRQG